MKSSLYLVGKVARWSSASCVPICTRERCKGVAFFVILRALSIHVNFPRRMFCLLGSCWTIFVLGPISHKSFFSQPIPFGVFFGGCGGEGEWRSRFCSSSSNSRSEIYISGWAGNCSHFLERITLSFGVYVKWLILEVLPWREKRSPLVESRLSYLCKLWGKYEGGTECQVFFLTENTWKLFN